MEALKWVRKAVFRSIKTQQTDNYFPICRNQSPHLSPLTFINSLFVAAMLPICRTYIPYLSHQVPEMSPVSHLTICKSTNYTPLLII